MAKRRRSTAPIAPKPTKPTTGKTRTSKASSRAGRAAKRQVDRTERKTSAVTRARASGRGRAPRNHAAKKQQMTSVAVPTRVMRIRQLDPHAACGPGTTVLQLFRVDDLPVGKDSVHLVFFDRHGWYCEHGRECPAVAAVKKHERTLGVSR